MKKLNKNTELLFISIIFSFCVMSMPSFVLARTTGSYELALSFATDQKLLLGTAKIMVPADQSLHLFLNEVSVSGSLLQTDSGQEFSLTPVNNALSLPAEPKPRILYISFSYTADGRDGNLISRNGISLTGNWFPLPEKPMVFNLSANLPQNFKAIVEADQFPLKQVGNTVSAEYSTPTTHLHFTAGPYIIHKLKVRDKLNVYTMFFEEDQDLVAKYLAASKDYLLRYETAIGPFPFNHYVVVANRMPTGYGIPTYTLIGQMVLRLPFILSTSLGHEIVHSWFGNSVEVDYQSGNWCEGLTTFLADQQYREDLGDGIAQRKESITKYLSFAKKQAPLSLAEFRSASHNQPLAEAIRAVGYNRGALFFYELKEKLGKETFQKGVQHIYKNFRGNRASWQDLRASFEAVSQADLGVFFQERLNRTDLPKLEVENVELAYKNTRPALSFELVQKTDAPYHLRVPIHITTSQTILRDVREIDQLRTPITIELPQRPLGFVIDPEITFLRHLSPLETVPVWSNFLGSDNKLIIVADEHAKNRFAALLQSLARYNAQIVLAEDVSNDELSKHDLLFLGAAQKPVQSLFGTISIAAEGFSLDTRKNPLNDEYTAVIVTAGDAQEVELASRKLRHYGNYSYLNFLHGKNLEKKITRSDNGLQVTLETLPAGNSTKTASNFQKLIQEISHNRVIYVGETHTSWSDHLLQLRIIEALYKLVPKLAIGMEMFPRSAQPVLNRYTLRDNQMDEQTFLKESNYFDVWRYDFRYFRNIFNFAKDKKIPVVGLNIEREVVSQVFRDGHTDGLKPSVRQRLPVARDLAMTGYQERLEQIYSMHTREGLASGLRSGFIQAQAIWDETMAENIVEFLKTNPEHTLVVLAGLQHTRKDSGIPPRVSRRIAVEQASVQNVYSSSMDNLSEIADYYFFSSQAELPEQPKIGIVLTAIGAEKEAESSRLRIDQFSPYGKAKEAGLQMGDILLRINKAPITSMNDVKIAMVDSREGDKVQIDILRGEGSNIKEMVFTVELTVPKAPPGHP